MKYPLAAAAKTGMYFRSGLIIGIVCLSYAFGQDYVWKPMRQFGYTPGGIMALSPDGSSLLTFSDKCYLLDAATGALKVVYYPKLSYTSYAVFNAIAFSQDGKLVATGYKDGTACVWNTATGDSTGLYVVDMPNDVHTVAFHPDGLRFLAASKQYVRLFNIKTGERIRTFADNNRTFLSAAISPDGKYILTGCKTGYAILWNVDSGDSIRSFSYSQQPPVDVVKFSPDGKLLLTGSHNDFVRVWNTETGDSVGAFATAANALAFSADGQYVATGSTEGVSVWNASTCALLRAFKPYYEAYSVDFTPDGKQVFAGCKGSISTVRNVRRWDVATGNLVDSISGCMDTYINTSVISPDGKYVCTAPGEGRAVLWNAGDGKKIGALKGFFVGVNSIVFSADGKYLVGSAGRSVFWWDVATRDSIRSISIYPAQIEAVALSSDSKLVLTGLTVSSSSALLWNAETGDSIRSFIGHTKNVIATAFSPDGKYALTGSEDQTARMWNIATGECIRTLTFPVAVSCVVFSPDGRYFLVGPQDAGYNALGFCLFETATGACVRSFAGHGSACSAVAFSPDGKLVLSGSADKDARLWNTATGKCLRVFKRHTSPITSVAFSPNGKSVLTSSWGDCNVFLWDISDVSVNVARGPAKVSHSSSSLRFLNKTTLTLTTSGLSPFTAAMNLYQPSGRLIRSISLGALREGTTTVRLDCPLAAGVYFYCLRSDVSGATVEKGGILHNQYPY